MKYVLLPVEPTEEILKAMQIRGLNVSADGYGCVGGLCPDAAKQVYASIIDLIVEPQDQPIAEVIATGGPHDREDRVLSELQAELPPVGTKLYAVPPTGPLCFCGLRQTKNPHPKAGVPPGYLEIGTVYDCIPCLNKSRHEWSQRATKAEAEVKRLESMVAKALNLDYQRRTEVTKLQGLLRRVHQSDSLSRNCPLWKGIDAALADAFCVTPTGTTPAEPKCKYCGDTYKIMVGRSGDANDGNAPILEDCEDCVPPKPVCLNDWFLVLEPKRQAVLREDKWMLANAAFEAGLRIGLEKPNEN